MSQRGLTTEEAKVPAAVRPAADSGDRDHPRAVLVDGVTEHAFDGERVADISQQRGDIERFGFHGDLQGGLRFHCPEPSATSPGEEVLTSGS